MPVYERLSMVVSLTLIGLALYFVVDLPPQTATFTLYGAPVAVTTSTRLLAAILLGGLALTGAGAVMRAHPGRRISYAYPFWVNATLIVVLATLMLTQLGNVLAWTLGLAITGALLWLSILAEYRMLRPAKNGGARWARLWSQGMSYALMPAWMLLMYQSQLGIVWQMAGIFAVSGLLASSLYKSHVQAARYGGVFSFLSALTLTQFAWVLNFWSLSAVEAALLAFLFFYIFSGLVEAHFKEGLSKRRLGEYAVVAVVGLTLIVWGIP